MGTVVRTKSSLQGSLRKLREATFVVTLRSYLHVTDPVLASRCSGIIYKY